MLHAVKPAIASTGYGGAEGLPVWGRCSPSASCLQRCIVVVLWTQQGISMAQLIQPVWLASEVLATQLQRGWTGGIVSRR